jgi:sugar O-acyltransferase (sialic acid O-acetyltransferase NeuD family)
MCTDLLSSNTGRILIVGAGGHGKVVADALSASRAKLNIYFVDDAPSTHGLTLLDFKVVGYLESVLTAKDLVHIAVGNNYIRERIYSKLKSTMFLKVTHPRASISQWAKLGGGCFIAANAIIGPDVMLGYGVVVNHGAIVDHDCVVGNFSHIAPGASLAGNVRIGARVLVGAGARILPGISVGDDVTVGAGAVVVNDIAPSLTVMGIPAKE